MTHNHSHAIQTLKKQIDNLNADIKSIQLNAEEPEMTSDLMFADEAIAEDKAIIEKLQTAIEILLKDEKENAQDRRDMENLDWSEMKNNIK